MNKIMNYVPVLGYYWKPGLFQTGDGEDSWWDMFEVFGYNELCGPTDFRQLCKNVWW
jgi:hypothetical protein